MDLNIHSPIRLCNVDSVNFTSHFYLALKKAGRIGQRSNINSLDCFNISIQPSNIHVLLAVRIAALRSKGNTKEYGCYLM
jgi:hypothetical protein